MTDEQDPDEDAEIEKATSEAEAAAAAAFALVGAQLHCMTKLVRSEDGRVTDESALSAVPDFEAFDALLLSCSPTIETARLIIEVLARLAAGQIIQFARIGGTDPIAMFQRVALRNATQDE